MSDIVFEIVEWVESLPKTELRDPEKIVATFKAKFPRVSLAVLDDALAICEMRAVEGKPPAGRA